MDLDLVHIKVSERNLKLYLLQRLGTGHPLAQLELGWKVAGFAE